MASQLQIRRGTTAFNNTFTGAQGELTMDTDLKQVRIHDNFTPGGFALASQTQVFNGTFYFNDNTSGGSASNAYILAPKANTLSPTQYLDGIQLGFTTNNANSGPSTATFNGLGVKSLKYRGGIDPAAGDIFGRVYLIYDSANDWFEIQRKAVAPPPQIRNLTGTVGSNALVAGVPAQTVDFRGTPVTNGTTTSITFTTALSITAPSGATLGTTSGVLSRIVVLALNNAGTVVLGLTNANNNTLSFDETDLVATTAIGAGSTSANVVYSAAGLSNVPYRVIGYIESTQATAGTWAASPSKVVGQGGQALILPPSNRFISAAAQNSTSGTSIDFTGIPSWVKRITVSFSGMSTSGTSLPLIQVGAGSVLTTGYSCVSSSLSPAGSSASFTNGISLVPSGHTAALTYYGTVVFSLVTGNVWAASGSLALPGVASTFTAGGVTLAGALDRVRITTAGGTDTFDAGVINISYEG